MRRHFERIVCLLACSVALSGLSACTTAGYYWQSVSGHLQLMQAARPIDHWLQDPQTPPEVKDRLALASRIRSFAVAQLALPDNPSYLRYADLQRSAAVWNVVAAPALSLELRQWCFPVAGCVSYKGYFDPAQAREEAERLQAEGLETHVHAVPAYSTLGWLNWAGGDPLLNTFIGYPEGELARLIFHELAHQVVYVSGDTAFNESFATAVERLGGRLWLARQASARTRQEFAAHDQRRQQFRALALNLRRQLELIYDSRSEQALQAPEANRQVRKEAAMNDFRSRYAELRAGWGGYAGYDRWVAGVNNASLGALAEYDDLAPGFEALFDLKNGQWAHFYESVRQLGELPRAERHDRLLQLAVSRAHPGNQAK